MSQINVRNLSNENDDRGPDVVGVSTFSATSYMVPPVGTTGERPLNPQSGDLRFNTDIGSLEYFRGNHIGWSQIEMTSSDVGISTNSSTTSGGLGARGVFGMRAEPSITSSIDYITIPTLGHAQGFGDSIDARYTYSSCASSTRGFIGGGASATVNTIEYIEFASGGNGTDFCNLTAARWLMMNGCASSTRGLFAGGLGTPTTVATIDYITMSSSADAQEFGNLTQARRMGSACSSSTRGVFAGGYWPGNHNILDFVTIPSLGNATDFGDVRTVFREGGGASNSTRGLWFGGSSPHVNTISYTTIATLGDAQDFGELNDLEASGGATSSPTRAVYGGGLAPGNTNIIEYVSISTLGNAKDFGDLDEAGHNLRAFSNAHGGL